MAFIRPETRVSSKIKNNERPEAGKLRGKKELLNGRGVIKGRLWQMLGGPSNCDRM